MLRDGWRSRVSWETERAVLVLNASAKPAQVRLPLETAGLHEGQVLRGALGGESHQAKGGRLEVALPALGFEILLSDSGRLTARPPGRLPPPAERHRPRMYNARRGDAWIGSAAVGPAMHLILTHEQADFDAVAALLAAKVLQPQALAVLPRRLNRNVRAFLTLYGDGLPFTDPDDQPRGPIERVTLVDTQSLPSIKGAHFPNAGPRRRPPPAGRPA